MSPFSHPIGRLVGHSARPALALAVVATWVAAAATGTLSAITGAAHPARTPFASMAGAPLRFVPNRGQWPSPVLYRAERPNGALFVTADGLTAVDVAADGRVTVAATPFVVAIDVDMDGDAPAHARTVAVSHPTPRFIPGARLPGVTHYLRGADPAGWVTDVPAFDALTVRGARPGVDARITVGADGAPALRFTAVRAGDVETAADAADDAARESAASDAVLAAAAPNTPTLAYSTFLGGRLNDLARGLAVDADGNAYIVGTTTSIDFPTGAAAGGPGPFQGAIGNSGSLQDAFVTKLDPTGTRVVWSTYLGGVRQDEAFDVAVDAAGRAHVTGYTTSPDFPTERAVQPALHLAEGIWSGDAFLARLSPDGSALEVGTFFGGTGRDVGKGIALGPDGATYIAGWTGSNLPAVNSVYPLNRGVRDAFIAKYTPEGDRLAFTTHLGGADADEARDIAVDAAGNATIVGSTISLNLRTASPFQRTLRGESDAFVARLNADGKAFGYATYLGGRGADQAIAVAVDAHGQAVVLGRTTSPDFPRAAAYQQTRSGPADLFVSRLTADGSSLVYSTYLGGSGDEGGCVQDENYRDLGTPTPDGRNIRYLEGSKFTDGPAGALALDAEGRAVIAGCTSSGNVPVLRPIQARRIGDYALLLAVFTPDGDGLTWGSYLGGRGMNVARAAAVGSDGSLFVAGQTDAPDFPTAPLGRALQAQRDGTDDAFVLRIADVPDLAVPTALPPTTVPTATDAPPSATPTSPPTATATPRVEATPTHAPTATVTVGRGTLYLPVADAP